MSGDDRYLDGNAAAGALSAVFAVDVTTAVGQCVACGRRGMLADTRAYPGGPGVVLRCVGCDGVLLRLVSGPTGTWLDVRGLTYLRLAPEA